MYPNVHPHDSIMETHLVVENLILFANFDVLLCCVLLDERRFYGYSHYISRALSRFCLCDSGFKRGTLTRLM
jgi:hypothetical protein